MMSGLMEAASAIMGAAERRLEVVGQNTANMATPGYRRIVAFEALLADRVATGGLPALSTITDLRTAQLQPTGNPLDLALGGDGWFLVRDGDRLLPSRGGAFVRDREGHVVDAAGRALQQSGGGDLVIGGGAVGIVADGTVLAEGQPVARIGVFALDDAAVQAAFASGLEAPPAEVDTPVVRQGMVESSNVVLGDEMVAMMAASRRAEGGARLAQVYDELIGRVISSIGQGGR